MLKRIAKTVLNILLFLCIIIIAYLTMLRGLFLENVSAKSRNDLNLQEIENLTKFSSGNIHDWIDEYLIKYDIPMEVLDEIEIEQKELVNEYINSFIETAKNGEDIPEIPEDKIKEIMIKGVKAYNKKYNKNLSMDKINLCLNDLTGNLKTALKIIHQNISFFGWFRFLLHDAVYYSFIVIMISLIVIMAITYRKEFFFSVGGISIFSGITLFITFGILKISAFQNILEFLPLDLSKLKTTCIILASILIIVGFLLLTIYKFIISMKKEKIKRNE